MKCYYKGEKVNGLKHGKGTLYSEDGRIIYEGDFKNNLFEALVDIIIQMDIIISVNFKKV